MFKKGYVMSEEHKRKISEAHKGKKHLPQQGFQKGHKVPKEWIEKIRKGNLGRIQTEEEIRKRALAKTGKPNFRKHTMGRYKNSNGYILIYNPYHPFCDGKGYCLEHRLVMEKLIGRYLTPKEEVHHRNDIRDDNRPKNLKLLANKSEHGKIHRPKGSYRVPLEQRIKISKTLKGNIPWNKGKKMSEEYRKTCRNRSHKN